jgi:hypothetical protein
MTRDQCCAALALHGCRVRGRGGDGGTLQPLAIAWTLARCRASGEQLQERRDGGGRFLEDQTDRSGLMN